ncbi:transglutaminase family protein [Spirosoma sp. KNUC1025]|uniref:transglutaminase family protein n=1 Tax=Spirosoma sp. KNUC1025 TaxID=2894082 RepID=UPI0038671AB2|nr:transglutaminase family protein [Spirosoma sp. KNUC1025]
MAIRVALEHYTQYDYDRMVYLSPQLIRLKPAAHSRATIESYSLTVKPENHVLHWQQDPFGNFIARVDFSGAIQSMTIDVQLVASLEPVNPFDFFIDTYAESFPFDYETILKKELALYLEKSELGPYLAQWLKQIDFQTKLGTVDFLIRLNQQVCQAIAYRERLQPGVQTPDETLQRAIGSCRDLAWLLVQLLRQLGLAARFVSGYLAQLKVETSVENGSSESVEDSLALHAWAEVYIPGAGWIGLDPTSGMLAAEGHIPLACTADPVSAAPLTGTAGLAETKFTYRSHLSRLL